ncbi:hypothetical protein [Pontibacter sp. G13]|uniref:hypothetical protein n=1 Tax=Pontibacter sp. G13 TaxID=3074898 RepID=UPI0028894009|nr:hypothetical protein [Pontibacter sp. G13]WNJ19079.1 hypothetical protein RJD25_01195 [Pontibacter sp. G13]
MKLNLLLPILGGSLLFAPLSGCEHAPSEARQPELVLFDFEQAESTLEIETFHSAYEWGGDAEDHHLHVKTALGSSKPAVILHKPANEPWDLHGFHQIQADVANLGEDTIQVEMFVGNDPDGLIRWYCSDYLDLLPGETGTITVDLSWTPWVFEPQPEMRGMRGMPGLIKTDLDKIDQFTFNVRYATGTHDFSVDNVRAVGLVNTRDTAGFFPFIDEFGQYIHRDWKGKIHSQEELKQTAEREATGLAATPGPADWSTFGGWKGGPKLEATGFFRAEKYQDKWFMVDPEGYLFWSAGLNCVSSLTGLSGVFGRENYFEGLPDQESDLVQFYDEGNWASHGFYKDKIPFTAYHFYQSNLYKKYGTQWLETFREQAHTRLRSWGLNTIGNVSDMAANRMSKTPYTGTVWINGTPKIEGSDGYWGKFHDVFDLEFRAAVRRSMEHQQAGANDPWCIGFFVDNELSWGDPGSLAMAALKSPETQAAKREFLYDLKAKYGSIEQLNTQWGTQHADWKALLVSTETPAFERAKEDLLAFYQKIGETYFRTIKEELSRIAPNQYYLGCRFAWANNDLTIRAAAAYCDILSFNKYEYSVEAVGLPAGVDKPILIGEFHFGALDRGQFHVGVKKAVSQEHRGQLYQSYIQGALRNDAIVGAHWFQYIDEPTTGRQDGENYNVGLVDICDTPYDELISKIRETNYEMYQYRLNN